MFSISAMAASCLLLVLPSANGQIVNDLPKLIDNSDLVAVVSIVGVVQTGSGTVTFRWGSVPAHFRIARLHVENLLKGTPPSSDIVVHYTVLYSPGGWSGGVPQGYTIQDALTPTSTRLVFLKSIDDHYAFTNGSYLSLMCAPDTPSDGIQASTFDAVVSRIIGALFSAKVPQQEKAEAIWQLRVTNSDLVVPALRAFLLSDPARQDEGLRTDALGALLWHKDTTILSQAETELLSGSHGYWKSNLLFAIIRAVPPSRSIPIIAKALADPDAGMRTAAAEAIYSTNSAEGVAPLLSRS